MMKYFRWLAGVLFGWRYVVLHDFDGAQHIRRIEFMGGKPFARRLKFNIANAFLQDGGGVCGVSYTVRWEPYDPLIAKRWPIPA